MEFDIGNILYVVITLIAVIVGLLGRKKKPAPGSQGEAPSSAEGGLMEGLENFLKMGQESPDVTDLRFHEDVLPSENAEEAPVAAEPEEVDQPAYMQEYDRILRAMESRQSEIPLTESDSLTEPLEVILLDQEEGTDYFEIVRDFDAGTAVVYSAIINRIDY